MRTTDIQSAAEGGALRFRERGYMAGFPSVTGTFTSGTGVPVNGIRGYAPGCIFYNWLGSQGTLLYYNNGTFASSSWVNIDSVIQERTNPVVKLTGTITLTALANGFRTNLFDLAGGFTATLPAATGSGLTMTFTVFVVSTTGYVLTANGSDVFNGSIMLTKLATTTTPVETFASTVNQNITLNGTTTGGVTIGDTYIIQDISSGIWSVRGTISASGTLATPFS